MKKLLRVVICFALVFALTGCYRVRTTMKVNNDKSVDFEMIYAVNSTAMKDFAKQMGGEDADVTESESTDDAVDPEDYKWLTDKGYSVAQYESKEKDDSGKEVVYNGVKLSKKFASIDDMAKADEGEVDFYKLFGNGAQDEETAKANFDDSKILNKKGNVYKANLVFDLSSEDNGGMDISSIASTFDLGYSITLPAKPKSHNATSVSEDGKTLTWKFDYGKKNKVEYEFELSNSSSTILYVFIGVIAVIVICVVIALVTQKKPTAGANIQPVDNTYNQNPYNQNPGV